MCIKIGLQLEGWNRLTTLHLKRNIRFYPILKHKNRFNEPQNMQRHSKTGITKKLFTEKKVLKQTNRMNMLYGNKSQSGLYLAVIIAVLNWVIAGF